MSLIFDAPSTALVSIDLQECIVAQPWEPHSGSTVVEHASELARTLRALGGVVAHVRVGWSHDFRDSLSQPCDQPTPRGPDQLPVTWMQFSSGLDVQPSDILVRKRQWGAVYGTELDLQLRRRGARTVIMCGIATNFAVESTARELWERGYALVFAEDGMASKLNVMHRFPIENVFPRIGRVRLTVEIVKALNGLT